MQKKEEGKIRMREQKGRGCGGRRRGCVNNICSLRDSAVYDVTELSISHCVDGHRWLQFFARTCMRALYAIGRRRRDQVAEMRSIAVREKSPWRLWKQQRPSTCYAKARTMASAKINYSPGIAASRRRKWRKRERRFALSVKERGWARWCRWRLRKSGRRHRAGCCWRHDFAGRNFAHVLLRERLKRDEPWRWKCVSRYLASAIFK